MTYLTKNIYLIYLFLFIPMLLTQCQSKISTEHQNTAQAADDTVEVASFNIERESNSPELKNWAVFEVNQDIICTPSGWTAHQTDNELVLLPPNSIDSIERITFVRFFKNSPSIDYNSFARRIAKTAFDDFNVLKGDTLNQLIFQRNFGYERNITIIKDETIYQGHCIVYVDKIFIYKYRIVLSKKRLQNYDGDLFADIISNLQFNKQYLLGNHNPLKQLIHIN